MWKNKQHCDKVLSLGEHSAVWQTYFRSFSNIYIKDAPKNSFITSFLETMWSESEFFCPESVSLRNIIQRPPMLLPREKRRSRMESLLPPRAQNTQVNQETAAGQALSSLSSAVTFSICRVWFLSPPHFHTIHKRKDSLKLNREFSSDLFRFWL